MRARKFSASAYLTNSNADRFKRTRTPRYRIDGHSVDAALYADFQAARPAILLYLKGKGPRPDDALHFVTDQQRQGLRRVHAKGIAFEDPRYIDAVSEAFLAGDSLSQTERKDLVEHNRVIEDGFLPAFQRRASELSDVVQVLGPKAEAYTKKQRDDLNNIRDKANPAKEERKTALQKKVNEYVDDVWNTLPRRQRTTNQIAKMMCNPHKTKERPTTLNMKNWKYRWKYKGKTETCSFRRLSDYVKIAVNKKRSTSA